MQFLTWTFQSYLMLWGVYVEYAKSTEYVVNWTMPQCVICLKMIMIAYDVFDGRKGNAEKLKEDRLEEVILEDTSKKVENFGFPNPLEFLSYSTFYITVLVGPQMSLYHYRKFIDTTDIKKCKSVDDFRSETRKIAGAKFLTAAFLMWFINFQCPYYLDVSKFDNENGIFFTEFGFLEKVMFITFFGNLKFLNYISTWMLVEGSLILSGVGTSFEKLNRHDRDKKLHHYHCTNAHFFNFLKATTMYEYVMYFNMNTNKWAFTYLFKRLAFLGNRDLSQLITLMYLALWHGNFPGYFTCFFYEFIILLAEGKMIKAGLYVKGWQPDVADKNQTQSNKIVHFLRAILQKFLHVGILTGYCMIDFCLLNIPKFLRVWKATYFYGQVFVVGQFLIASLVISLSRGKRKRE